MSPAPRSAALAAAAAALLLAAAPATVGAAADYAPGSLLVLRVGPGLPANNGSLAGPTNYAAAAQLFLDNFDANPVLAAVGPLGSISVHGVTISGTDWMQGTFARSGNGAFATFAGLSAPPGRLAPLTCSSSLNNCWSGFNRVLVRVAHDGTVSTNTVLSSSVYNGIM